MNMCGNRDHDFLFKRTLTNNFLEMTFVNDRQCKDKAVMTHFRIMNSNISNRSEF